MNDFQRAVSALRSAGIEVIVENYDEGTQFASIIMGGNAEGSMMSWRGTEQPSIEKSCDIEHC